MLAFIVRRVLATIPVMLVVAVVVFLLLHLSPGDPAAIIAGDSATDADIERVRATLGLDRPLIVQFGLWLGGLLRGDLGVSVFSKLPVLSLITQRLEPTGMLAIATMSFAILVALPLGIIAAWKAGTWIDHLVMGVAVFAFSAPVFLIGYALVYQFARQWRILPVQGYTPIGENFTSFWQHLVLPALSLGLIFAALLARMTRSTMLDVLNEDYIRTARAKGLAPRTVLIRHALKNAAVPIVTTIGLGIALLIGGVVVAESVFAIPGIGRLTIEAVTQRDYPVIQGVILMASFVYVLINLAIDVAYAFLDPRIRY
ncbi:MAG: ABC transporter permease [Acetobacteraceae bacterium]